MPFSRLLPTPSAVPRSGAAGARPSPESQGEASAATISELQREIERGIARRTELLAEIQRLREQEEFENLRAARLAEAERIAAYFGMRVDDYSGEDRPAVKRTHDMNYVEGFEERWDDPHASLKRGP